MNGGPGTHDELARYLSVRARSGRVLLCRGEDERRALAEWLAERPAARTEEPLGLADLVSSCRRCGESSDARPGIGSGSSGVMIVLNPPLLVGRAEIELLKKESAELLKKIIAAAGLEPAECYITALVKCATPDPLMEPSLMVKNCGDILRSEIAEKAPRLVLVFGDIRPLQPIIKDSGETAWFNLDHPITMIKNPELKKGAWNTLKLAMAKLAAG